MKGNKALQVSKIKSHARHMTDNRRDVPEVRPDDKGTRFIQKGDVDTPGVQCCPKDLLTFCHNYQYNRYLYTII